MKHVFAKNFVIALALVSGFSATAYAGPVTGTITVDGRTVIQASGTQSSIVTDPSYRFLVGGLPAVHINAAGVISYTFSVTGVVTPNNNFDRSGGDGVSYPENISAIGGISGINADVDAYLAGVFLGPGGPGATPPSDYDFSSAGIGTAFSSLTPGLGQVFFIGDGLTGTGSGASQVFYAPAGATRLYLAISDACNPVNPQGDSCYNDNFGSFDVAYVGTTPEPSSLALLGTGLLGLGGFAKHRFKRS